MVRLQRGPVIVSNEQAVYEQLVAYVKKTYRGVALVVEPNSENEPSGPSWRESNTDTLLTKTVVLNLTKADGVLLAEMSPETRERLREAGSAVLTVKKIGNPEGIAACYRLYKNTSSPQRNTIRNEKYFHELHDKLGEFSALFGAFEGDSLVSFIWLAISESTAVELYRGNTPQGTQLCAEYGLRWEAVRRVKQWGIPTYDVGGFYDDTDSRYGFGSEYTTFGTFSLPLSPFYTIWTRTSLGRNRYSL